MTVYQKQLTLGIVGVFLFGLLVGYKSANWLAAPCQTLSDTNATPQTAAKDQSMLTVKNVIDGVSLDVDTIGVIRLAGVELAPQSVSDEQDPAHKDAVTYLNTEVLNKQVKLEKSNGLSGTVYYVYTPGGTLINVDMVRRGLLFRSENGAGEHIEELRTAMNEAIRANRGLWKLGISTSASDIAAKDTTPPTSTDKNKPDTKKTPDVPLHNDKPTPPVNPNSGVKKNELEVVVLPGSSQFHRPDCPDVKGKSGTVRMYISDARNAGLKPDAKCFTSVTMRAP